MDLPAKKHFHTFLYEGSYGCGTSEGQSFQMESHAGRLEPQTKCM